MKQFVLTSGVDIRIVIIIAFANKLVFHIRDLLDAESPIHPVNAGRLVLTVTTLCVTVLILVVKFSVQQLPGR